MKKVLALLAGAAALALSQVAAAQGTGWYVGGAVGQVKAKDWCSDEGAPAGVTLLTCDDSDTAWKIIGGYQFHPNFAAEIQFMNLGSVSASANVPPFGTVAVSADNTQFAASILGIVPIGQVQLFGKLGLESISQDSSASVGGFSSSDTGSDSGLLVGVGLKFPLGTNLRLRGEWEHGDTLNTDIVTLGAEWRF